MYLQILHIFLQQKQNNQKTKMQRKQGNRYHYRYLSGFLKAKQDKITFVIYQTEGNDLCCATYSKKVSKLISFSIR
jgi:hypothetical protein